MDKSALARVRCSVYVWLVIMNCKHFSPRTSITGSVANNSLSIQHATHPFAFSRTIIFLLYNYLNSALIANSRFTILLFHYVFKWLLCILLLIVPVYNVVD